MYACFVVESSTLETRTVQFNLATIDDATINDTIDHEVIINDNETEAGSIYSPSSQNTQLLPVIETTSTIVAQSAAVAQCLPTARETYTHVETQRQMPHVTYYKQKDTEAVVIKMVAARKKCHEHHQEFYRMAYFKPGTFNNISEVVTTSASASASANLVEKDDNNIGTESSVAPVAPLLPDTLIDNRDFSRDVHQGTVIVASVGIKIRDLKVCEILEEYHPMMTGMKAEHRTRDNRYLTTQIFDILKSVPNHEIDNLFQALTREMLEAGGEQNGYAIYLTTPFGQHWRQQKNIVIGNENDTQEDLQATPTSNINFYFRYGPYPTCREQISLNSETFIFMAPRITLVAFTTNLTVQHIEESRGMADLHVVILTSNVGPTQLFPLLATDNFKRIPEACLNVGWPSRQSVSFVDYRGRMGVRRKPGDSRPIPKFIFKANNPQLILFMTGPYGVNIPLEIRATCPSCQNNRRNIAAAKSIAAEKPNADGNVSVDVELATSLPLPLLQLPPLSPPSLLAPGAKETGDGNGSATAANCRPAPVLKTKSYAQELVVFVESKRAGYAIKVQPHTARNVLREGAGEIPPASVVP
ncbi:unnamed protein product [Darwinula stevensoni]|uniref:Uncharacterized protein n=1 Tax=Darwinula stevensoni TaxID=69355 RepID=A0A7R8XD13_9CRUS|nr:unnamed protein product [Darwinula stevensoni]CAG0889368.1 unnamed protein product [Darwinula stevensoni]